MNENKLPVKVRSNDTWDSHDLLCPHCGSDYLHHGPVEVFNPRGQDANIGLHVKIKGDSLSSDSDLTGNPSARRHGMTIEFNCEICNGFFKMRIAQHKGQTHIGFEPTKGTWERGY